MTRGWVLWSVQWNTIPSSWRYQRDTEWIIPVKFTRQPGCGHPALQLMFTVSYSKPTLPHSIHLWNLPVSASIPYISQIYYSLCKVVFPLICPKILWWNFKEFAPTQRIQSSLDKWLIPELGQGSKGEFGILCCVRKQGSFQWLIVSSRKNTGASLKGPAAWGPDNLSIKTEDVVDCHTLNLKFQEAMMIFTKERKPEKRLPALRVRIIKLFKYSY